MSCGHGYIRRQQPSVPCTKAAAPRVQATSDKLSPKDRLVTYQHFKAHLHSSMYGRHYEGSIVLGSALKRSATALLVPCFFLCVIITPHSLGQT